MTVPIAVFQVYPVVCTDRNWQKFKTFKDKAKASTKTGLGATLKTAEQDWLKIKWAQLDAKKLKAKTVTEANSNKVKAQAMLLVVQQASKSCEAARVKAEATMKNQSLSQGAKDRAESIRNGLKACVQRLGTVNLTDFDEEIDRLLTAK
jgi:hypothetical protein